MSVATTLSYEELSYEELDAPIFDIPQRARTRRPERPLATVTDLYRPSERSVAPPLRLTRRGTLVLSGLVAMLAAGLVGLAWASAPPSASSGSAVSVAPAIVTVQAGDSLWTIAARVAPQTDPRAEVAQLQRINHLGGVELLPGQLIRTR